MKVIITGAHGMLGSAICRFLHDKAKVYAFHRDEQNLLSGCKPVSVDLQETSKLKHLLREIRPDLIIHCAGLIDIDRCTDDPRAAYEQNVLYAENLVQICEERTKFIYVSSDQVYGEITPKDEGQRHLSPINTYGETKLAGELAVLSHHAHAMVVRTNIVGSKLKSGQPSFAEWVFNSLTNGDNISLFDDYVFSPIHTSFFADILWGLVLMGFEGIVNIGSCDSCSKYDFGRQLAELSNLDYDLIHRGSIEDSDKLKLRPRNLTLNVDKLRALGINPPTFQETVERFLGHCV